MLPESQTHWHQSAGSRRGCPLVNLGFGAIRICRHARLRSGMHGLLRLRVPREPVVMHVALFLGHAANDDGRLRGAERVVGNLDTGPGDVGAVLAVAASVHIETVAH